MLNNEVTTNQKCEKTILRRLQLARWLNVEQKGAETDGSLVY